MFLFWTFLDHVKNIVYLANFLSYFDQCLPIIWSFTGNFLTQFPTILHLSIQKISPPIILYESDPIIQKGKHLANVLWMMENWLSKKYINLFAPGDWIGEKSCIICLNLWINKREPKKSRAISEDFSSVGLTMQKGRKERKFNFHMEISTQKVQQGDNCNLLSSRKLHFHKRVTTSIFYS